ncbi:hypothetical protein ACFO5K_06835 [Nocardia halotolerans]|uniref:DUF8176 domain-containing protein n=1 Tax=Nocardia halotolerans TaxID=1755878 RepID=A0ABV8VCW0_9NOCA
MPDEGGAMDRPDVHEPRGARQRDPGSAGVPFAAATPVRPNPPRPRRPERFGPRRRADGGPITPAGIPVISLAGSVTGPAREDSYATDRLPVVGGPFDPGAHAADTAFAIEEPDNGPDTDQLPIITPDFPVPAGIPHSPAPAQPPPSPAPSGAPHSSAPVDTPNVLAHPSSPRPPEFASAQYPSAPVDSSWPSAQFSSHDPAATAATSHSPAAADTPHPLEAAIASHAAAAPAPDYNGDDEVFARMIDRSKRRRTPRWVAPLAASVVGAGLIGGGYLQLHGPAPESAAASTTIDPIAAGPVPVAGQCPTEQVGSRVQGNGPGGTDSGISAIMAFQHAYYVARSGDQARTLVAGDAALPSGVEIQSGIDTIPVGTTHCLEITPGAFAGQYFVTITEFRPDSVPIVYNPQLVGTAQIGSKTLITSIGPVR